MTDIEIVGRFQNPWEALAYIKNSSVNLALIYITVYKQYAFDAFQMDACAYMLKPFNREDLEKAIIKAVKLADSCDASADVRRVFIRTFIWKVRRKENRRFWESICQIIAGQKIL